MKQFNLEEYLANPSKKIITRDGRNARIICTDAKNTKYQVVALVTKSKGQEVLATLDASGKYHSGHNSHLDLFFASERKHESRVNLYIDEQNEGIKKGIDNLLRNIDILEKLRLYLESVSVEKEIWPDYTPVIPLNDIMNVAKADILKSIDSALKEIMEHLDRMEE